jgi:DNA-binding CsgD family transcriptional regulator/tetratricopeptide (TPR) repeat protein
VADVAVTYWRQFVGRVEELRQLDAAVSAARNGRGTTMFIVGEAGIGKTSLAEACAERARRAGATVLVGRCIPLVGEALAYLPLIDAFRSLPAPPDFDDGGSISQLQLFESVLAGIDGLDAAPLVLVVEDVHWADASTLAMLTLLAYAASERRLLVVATLRREELRPASRLADLLGQLVRARRATELPVDPLNEAELGDVLRAASAEPVPADLVVAIHARSEGNPFFAEELLVAVARGDEQLPAKLRDVLLLHIAQLSATARAALRVVAATGRDVPYRLLAAVSSMNEPQLIEALREAAEQGVMLFDQPTSTYRLKHALLGEAIYTTLLPGEREEIHLRIARAIDADASLAASGRVAAELAHHWVRAGHPARALVESVRAACDAEAAHGLVEALRHVDLAIALWPTVPDAEALTQRDLGELSSWAARLCDVTGDIRRAIEFARRHLELAGPDIDPARHGLLYERLGTYLLHTGAQQDALVALRRAVDLVPPQPPSTARARALAAFSYALMAPEHYGESLETATAALAVAEEVGDDRAALLSMTVIGRNLSCLGRSVEGVEHLHLARGRARERGTPEELTRIYILLSDVLITAGRLHEAIRVATEGLAVACRHGMERGHGLALRVNAANAYLATGEWSQADQVLNAALRTVGTFWTHHPHLLQARLDIGRGDYISAQHHLDAAAQAVDKLHAAAHYAYLTAELALWQERPDDAVRAVDEGLDRVQGPVAIHEQLALWVQGLRADVELAQRAAINRDTTAQRRVHDHAGRLIEVVRATATRTDVYADDAGAWRAQAEAEYARVIDGLDPRLWEAAVAAWDAIERPYFAAYCRWRLAESLVAAQVPAAIAATPAREAHRVARWLAARPLREELEQLAARARLDLEGLSRQPAETQSPAANPLGLTDRERDVLQLLSRGYTNRDIGAELTISAKTASVHVSNILRKLNARTRVEAAAIAHRLLPRRESAQ